MYVIMVKWSIRKCFQSNVQRSPYVVITYPGPLSDSLKNDVFQKALFNRRKHAFWTGALDSSYKDLAIEALEALVQNPTTFRRKGLWNYS